MTMFRDASSGRLLLEVEDKESNVVLLRAAGVVARKNGDAFEEGVGETRGRNIALRFQKLFAPRLAEFFPSSVLGFEDAVRVEQTAISGGKANFRGRVDGFGKHTQHQAVLFNFLDVTCYT